MEGYPSFLLCAAYALANSLPRALRASQIEGELIALEIAAERIVRKTRAITAVPGMSEESQRVDIVLKEE